MKARILVSMAALALFATPLVHAADALLKADIPFQFTAGTKVLPSGQYEFGSDSKAGTVTVRSTSGNSSAVVLILTRMAAGMHTTPADDHVVFDKIGETYTLSEIWVVGKDGFALNAPKVEHEHRIINVPR